MNLRAFTLLIELSAVATEATAQSSRTFYDATGKITARSITGSNGATTFFGADGKVAGRTSVGSDGTVTTYSVDGRVVGRITGEKRR